MKKNPVCRWAGCWMALVLGMGGGAAQAQFTGSYQTNYVDGVTNVSYAGVDYTIGNGYSGDGLIVTNAGRLQTGTGYMGMNSGNNGNWALVTGAGSVWTNSGWFYTGYDGSGNTLTITNGGQVVNAGVSHIGYDPGANNNSVLVTGAGATWNVGNQICLGGDANTGNNLQVLNGGHVSSYSSLIGDYSADSHLNWILVSGAGSF